MYFFIAFMTHTFQQIIFFYYFKNLFYYQYHLKGDIRCFKKQNTTKNVKLHWEYTREIINIQKINHMLSEK